MRPRTRAQCIDGPRPCPWISCRYHLLVETLVDGSLSVRSGGRRITIPRSAPDDEFQAVIDAAIDSWFESDLPSCALDHIAKEQSLAEVGARMGLTRQRVQQIEMPAQDRLRQVLAAAGIEATITLR